MARRTQAAVAAPVVDVLAIRNANIETYLDSSFALDGAQRNAKTDAANLLRPCVAYVEVESTRDELKARYIARLVASGSTADKAKDAANMFWSRTVARAKEMGVTLPVKPQSDTAQAAQATREVKRAEKRTKAFNAAKSAGASDAVANAMADQVVDARKQKTAKVVESPIVDGLSPEVVAMAQAIEASDDLFNAIDWILENPSRIAQLTGWITVQQKSTTRRVAGNGKL